MKEGRLFPNVLKIVEASRGSSKIMRVLLNLVELGQPVANDMLIKRFAGCLQETPCWPVKFQDLLRVEEILCNSPERSRLVSNNVVSPLGIRGAMYMIGPPLSIFAGVVCVMSCMDDPHNIMRLPDGVDLFNVNIGEKVLIGGQEFVLVEIKTQMTCLPMIAYLATTKYVKPADVK